MSQAEEQFMAENKNVTATPQYAGGKAALTEASRHADILYTSLFGVAAIVITLLAGLALPVFGVESISSATVLAIMTAASLVGVSVLCYINLRAHRQISMQARRTEVLLNSLGQAFLSFNAAGICDAVYSEACLDLLEGAPAGKDITDFLRLGAEQKSDFKDWLGMLFVPNHALSFEDVAKFLPQTFPHQDKRRRIELLYKPVHNSSGELMSIVLIATDQTEEIEASLRTDQQQNYINMICSVFRERNQFMTTITHLRKFIEESKVPAKVDDPSSVLRLLHTLKAACKHFHLDSLSLIVQRLEVDLRHATTGPDDAFRILLAKGGREVEASINEILEQVGDLIGQDYEGRGNLHEVDEDAIYDFARVMYDRGVDPALVKQYLSAIAAVPVNEAFSQFERELKDLAVIMGKKVKPIRYTGTNPRVLAKPMDGFFLSTMHICRNIVDHGIEPVVTRLARDKEPAGLVTIHTDLLDDPATGRKILQIIISDDGNGIDPALVRAKLAKIAPDGDWRQDDDEAVIQRILLWEVTTRDSVTDLSGRGVGMEAVDREVKLLGGTIRVLSELYKGTRFDIRLPYTLDAPAAQK